MLKSILTPLIKAFSTLFVRISKASPELIKNVAFLPFSIEPKISSIPRILAVFNVETIEDLFAEVGAGHLTGREVIEAIFPGTKKKSHRSKVVRLFRLRGKKKAHSEQKNSIPIKGLIPGMALHFAGCCHALPGDRIVGMVTKGRGITIHTIDCETLEEFADTPERWLDVSWEDDANNERRVGRIMIVVANELGTLGELSTIIAKNDGNINNLKNYHLMKGAR